MNKFQITFIIIGFFLLALMATNPSIEDHRQAVMNELEKKMSQESNPDNKWEQVGQSIGMALGQGIIDKAVSRENFLVFSIPKISFNSKTKSIGYGFLGKFWITEYSFDDRASTSKEHTDSYPVADTTAVSETSEINLDKPAKFILSCYPPSGTNLILGSPNKNDIHPAWLEEFNSGGSLGSGWSFNAVKRIDNPQGVFLLGDIYTTRGGLFNSPENGYQGMVYVPLSDWECTKYPGN